jgi:hypothetical protein
MHRSTTIVLASVLLSCSCGTKTTPPEPPTLKPAPAPEQEAPPLAAEDALAYTLDLEIDHEHGCSQSHQSTGVDIELSLQVSAANEATLTLHLDSTSVMGPSFSSYQQGDQDFTTTYTEEQSVWTGTARRSGSRLSITFEWVETASYEVYGYGGELPPAKRSPSSLSLLCSKSSVLVYEAVKKDESFWDVEGKTAEPHEVMLCKPSEEILGWHHDMALVDGGIPLAAPPGIAMLSTHMFYNESQVIRHVP